MFGQNKPLFGAPAQAPSAFGVPSTSFGAASPQPAFGAPQPQQSLFGSPQVGGFGQTQANTGLFGQPAQQPSSIFGATNTSVAATGGFGFGQKPGGPSIFGGTPANTASGGGMFGSQAPAFGSQVNTFGVAQAPVGTTVKFQPVPGTDTMMKNGNSTSINTRHQCITAMKEYESKSLDELRMEDYMAGRKTGAVQTNQGFGTAVGQPAQAGGLFGQTSAAPSFGAATTAGLFGQTKPAFGTPTATTQAQGGLFGGTSAFNKPAFGTTNTFGVQQQPQTSIFGTTNTGFGTSVAQQPSLFSSQNTAISKPFAFATPTQAIQQQPQGQSFFGQTPTAFGTPGIAQPQQQQKSLFGTTTPAFGTSTVASGFPSFNTATNTTNSLFGAGGQQQSTLFGANTATKPFTFNTSTPSAFGVTQSTPSLLGGTQTATNSLFNPVGTGGAFGQNSSLFGTGPTTNTSTGGLFGGAFGQSSGLGTGLSSSFNFGQSVNVLGAPSGSLLGGNSNYANNSTGNSSSEMLIARLQTLPYGNSTLFEKDMLASSNVSSSSVKLASDVKSLNQFNVGSKQAAIKRIPASTKNTTSLLFDGMEEEDPKEKLAAIDMFKPRKNFKKLDIKSKQLSSNATPDPVSNQTRVVQESPSVASPSLNLPSQVLKPPSADIRSSPADNTVLEFARRHVPRTSSAETSPANTPVGATRSKTVEDYSLSPASLRDLGDESSLMLPKNTSLNLKCGLKSTRPDYYTIPSLDTLDKFIEATSGECLLDSFTVGRKGYGSVFWGGPINVRGLNLDEIVHIRRKEVIVYPDDDNKPSQGQGLNRPAQVTLDQVWPIDKSTREIIKDVQRLERMRYSEKVEAATAKLNATFKDYRPETGSWVFLVRHFSKYGLLDDDDDENDSNSGAAVVDTRKSAESAAAASMATRITSLPSKSATFQEGEPLATYSQRNPVDTNRMRETEQFGDGWSSRFAQGQKYFYPGEAYSATYDAMDYIGQPLYGVHQKEADLMEPLEEFADEFNRSYGAKSPTAYEEMRSVLFPDDDFKSGQYREDLEDAVTARSVFKKSRKFYGRPSASASDLQFVSEKPPQQPSIVGPSIPRIVHKRRAALRVRTNPFVSTNHVVVDISSVKCAPCPRVSFSRGSGHIITYEGSKVTIHSLQLIPEILTTSNTKRVEAQLQNHTVITTHATLMPVAETRLKSSNPFNVAGREALVVALHGDKKEPSEYGKSEERINAVIDWLADRNRTLYEPPTTSVGKIMYYLSINDVKTAVNEALSAKEPRLATLIACGTCNSSKDAVLAQLDSWKLSGADEFIEKDLLKLYILLSGGIRWRPSSGSDVGPLLGLQWSQQLALLLLYATHSGLADCVEQLTHSLGTSTNDVEYHLLAEDAPWVTLSACANELEAWFLHQSLVSYGVVESSSLSEAARSDIVHGVFVAQLLAQSPKWAAFVAIHINDDELREYVLQEVLSRGIVLLSEEDITWIEKSLLIPERAIAKAKHLYDNYLLSSESVKEANIVDEPHFLYQKLGIADQADADVPFYRLLYKMF